MAEADKAARTSSSDARRAATALRQQLRASGIKDDAYWAAEMLVCILSAEKIVARGEGVFFDNDNPVEIAAARQHVIDLDSAARHVSDAFKAANSDIPWTALARTRDRNAHHYDNINRDVIWNVLVIEFPKIRDTLRTRLDI